MTSEVVQALARHALTLLAGWLVNSGYMSDSDQQTLIGLGVGIAVLGWSIFNKAQHKAALTDAQGVPS